MTGHNIFKSILSLFLSYDKTFYTWEVNMARIIDTTEKNLIGHKVKQLRKKHHMSQKELSEKLETYAEKRAALKKIVNSGDPAEAFEAAQKLQAIPKNANPIRMNM